MFLRNFVLVLLFLIILTQAQNCYGQNCEVGKLGSGGKAATFKEADPKVDKEVRRVYWYYLWNSQIIYKAQLNTPEAFLFFYIYRNSVGTFLCVASWNKKENVPGVENFVRLGNGINPKQDSPFKPVKIQPIILSMRFKPTENYVTRGENGELTKNGEIVSASEKKNLITDPDEKMKILD